MEYSVLQLGKREGEESGMSTINHYTPKSLRNGKCSVMVERFASVDEVVRVSANRKLTHWDYTDFRDDDNLRSSHHGVDTWEEAENLMLHGYSPFVKKLQSKLNFTAKGQGIRTQFRSDVVGGAPIVPLAIIGVPTSMMNAKKVIVPNKVVNIYFDKVAVCDKSSKQIEDACAKFMSALIEVENLGYRINLYITEAHTEPDGSNIDMMVLKVKDSNSPLDLQRISFPLAHAAFFRVIGFDWFTRCPEARYKPNLGTNMTRKFSHQEVVEAYEDIFREKCVVFEMEDIITKDEKHIIDAITVANNRYR